MIATQTLIAVVDLYCHLTVSVKMSDGQNEDKLALVPVQGNEMHNELALLNDELVVDFDDFLPVLEVQENAGVFEQVSDDGQSKHTVQQLQQMELRGMDTNAWSLGSCYERFGSKGCFEGECRWKETGAYTRENN